MISRTYRCLLCILVVSALLAACGGDPTPTSAPRPAPSALPPTDPPPTDPPPPTATATPTTAPTEVLPPTPTSTATPTPIAAPQAQATPTSSNDCAGFAGSLEIAVLVGPADAAGLEPEAVGAVPITAIGGGDPCVIEGQGPINYEAVLAKAWGTYAVTMDLDFAISGTCSGPKGQETLELSIEMSGQQNVSVKATGFSGEYPWSGTQTRQVTLPLQEGASAMGEGWGVVLHLGQ